MKRIASAANSRYKELRGLFDSSRERKRSGLSILDGTHLVAAYLEHAGLPEQLVLSQTGAANAEIQGLLARMEGVDRILLTDELFRTLSSVVTPTGILALIRTPGASPVPRSMESCVMLEDLQDPGNLGSILRTCAAAGIRHVLLSPGCVQPWSPRVLRAAMGAHFALALHEGVELRVAASGFDGRLVATALRARQSVFDADLKGRVAFMFGNEGAGLSAGLLASANVAVSIPMTGKTESLNVAAAAAICLFERVRQLRSAQ